MIRCCRTILIATLIATPNMLFAAEADFGSITPARHLTYNGQPLTRAPMRDVDAVRLVPLHTAAATNMFGQWGYGHHGHHNDGAITAMVLGAAGVIAGTATLVYANRPECSVSPYVQACGYGTRVIGSSVLAAGVASLLIGAVTWH